MGKISDMEEELNEAKKKLELAQETLTKIANGFSDEAIGFGSRVRLKYKDGRTKEGRVWRVKSNDVFAINRDGYAAELLVKGSDLIHLSVGSYGRLERQQWVLQNRITVLQHSINEEINKQVFGIKELLCKGIDFKTAQRIIDRKDFQSWYKANSCEKNVPWTDLGKASPLRFKCITD